MASSHHRFFLVLALATPAVDMIATSGLHAQVQQQPPFDIPELPGPAGKLDFFPIPQDDFPPPFMPAQVQAPDDGGHVVLYIVAAILGAVFVIAVITLVALKASGAF